ncbi:MAG: xanthine dehydrogenase family protein subunit M [Pseudomonadales bacterium]|nr:xanthine dehydrogenase family protein subunit M [Pseudomonadales bacterium]
MAVVDYLSPTSVADAVKCLAGSPHPAKVLAGGTDLIIQSKGKYDSPLIVVDVKKIGSMVSAELTDDALILGPSMPCAELTAREDIKSVFPGLVEAAFLIGSTQVQGRASVGGNLCNASPAGDTIPALIANAAQCVIAGPNGERTVPVESFVTGVGKNCMTQGELLVSIRIPRPAAGSSDAYLRFIPRTEMDIAVAGAGVAVTLDSTGKCTAARVAIGAVAPTALLVPEAAAALVGSTVDDASLAAAAAAATAASNPITDRRGTAEYRRHVVGVLVKRAAAIAAQRARSVK